MEATLTTIGTVVTAIVTNAGAVVSFMTSNPILLIPFGFGMIGGAVALVKRFAH